jgi:hypothetical protein
MVDGALANCPASLDGVEVEVVIERTEIVGPENWSGDFSQIILPGKDRIPR